MGSGAGRYNVRFLGLTAAFWLATLLPTSSLALGLGEIEVKSFLNQPLNAEIEVLSARPGEIDDLLVSLASRDAFSRAGLTRPRHLSDLRFSVRKNEEGDEAVIVITTKSGVKEPFLNFLIEADWSKGRLLREYTILLDPPFFADQPLPAESPAPQPATEPVSESSSVSQIAEQAGVSASPGPVVEPIVETMVDPEPGSRASASTTEPIGLDESPSPPPVSTDYASDSQNIIQGDVLVVKGDTLWSIASQFKDDRHSMSQVMLAFQRGNPDAFRDGNINHLKAGAILRAPSAAELDAIGAQEAQAEVLVQNGLWEEYVARVTGVSPAVSAEETMAEPAVGSVDESSSELSLLMPDEGTSESAGTGDSAEIEALRNKLSLAEEELEAARIENSDLESRIGELQARLSKVEELQKMVEIEDDSLAQLQQQAQQQQTQQVQQQTQVEAPEPESETPGVISDEALQADEAALIQELLAEEAAAQAEEEAMLAEASTTQTVQPEVAESAVATATETAAVETAAEADTSEQTAPPAPIIVTQPPGETSMFDGIPVLEDIGGMLPSMPDLDLGGLSGFILDPIILGAVGGVIVILLALVLIKKRRAAGEDDSDFVMDAADDIFTAHDEEDLTPIQLADSDADQLDSDLITDVDTDFDDFASAETGVAEGDAAGEYTATAIVDSIEPMEVEPAAAAAASSDQDDVLNEVDVYLAYGLYDNAEELLNSSLQANPERADYRSKLLDTYFATKNTSAFVNEAQNLRNMGDAAGSYWDRVQVMGYELAPDNPLFSDAKDSDLSAADLEIAKPQEADFDLGATEGEDTNFAAADFNLGDDDSSDSFLDTQHAFDEAGDLSETQQLDQAGDLDLGEDLDLGDELDTDFGGDTLAVSALDEPESEPDLELPEEIGDELEFSMDEPAGEAAPAADEADLGDFDMAFDMDEDTAQGDIDDADIDFGAEFEAALEEAEDLDLDDAELIPFKDEVLPDDDAVELDMPDSEEMLGYEQTAVVDTTQGFEATEVMPAIGVAEETDLGLDEIGGDDDTFGLDLDETAMQTDDASLESDDVSLVTGEISLATGEISLETDDIVIDPDEDDEEDISIIDFGGEDFIEPTDIFEPAADDSTIMSAVDFEETGEVKTDTFAPGDFDEPTSAMDSVDDIADMMLPDDVDEVSTKLDLARAFIDMGDTEGARGSLKEVLTEGNAQQQAEAQTLLEQI